MMEILFGFACTPTWDMEWPREICLPQEFTLLKTQIEMHFNASSHEFTQIREDLLEIIPIGSEIIHVDFHRIMDKLNKDAQECSLKSGRLEEFWGLKWAS